MNNRYFAFMQANKELWSKAPTSEGSNGLLLVEPHYHPIISHANAVFARIIKEARGLSIRWIDNGDPEIQERLASYDSTSRTVPLSKLTLFDRLRIALKFVYSAVKMLLTGDIRGFSLDGIPFGDIVYDCYLSRFEVATIRRVDIGVLRILLALIKNYYKFKKTLKATSVSAVLVSHQVGLKSGVLMRTALTCGMKVYLRTGGGSQGVTFKYYNSIEEIYKCTWRPKESDIAFLLGVDPHLIENHFAELMKERKEGKAKCKDAVLAYHKDKTLFTSRKSFAERFNLDSEKKNIFVMLHAFNDHPHSHYGKMLFRDYYDWFAKTLEFAKTKTNVNWIFKEHPSSKYYPTRDVSLQEHFRDCPSHIVFLDAESSFNSYSLFYLADVVITVVGTAGVEFAAAAGVPCVIAGNTFYDGHSFTIEPASKGGYFNILSNIERIGGLTEKQQYMAKVVFLFTRSYCRIPCHWTPLLPYEETIKKQKLDTYYWNLVVKRYREQPRALLRQFNEYVNRVKHPDFSRFLNFSALEVASKESN